MPKIKLNMKFFPTVEEQSWGPPGPDEVVPHHEIRLERSLFEIAKDIYEDWGFKITPSAKPYLDAMRNLDTKNSFYGAESAHEIVCRFLINASQWRGPKARAIKAELKELFKS